MCTSLSKSITSYSNYYLLWQGIITSSKREALLSRVILFGFMAGLWHADRLSSAAVLGFKSLRTPPDFFETSRGTTMDCHLALKIEARR